MNGDSNSKLDVAVLENRVDTLERGFNKIASAIESIDQSLQVLTRLDIKHDETAKAVERAFTEIRNQQAIYEKLSERMRYAEGAYTKSADLTEFRRSCLEKDEKTDTRIKNIEDEMPTMKLIKRGIIYIITMIFGILVVAVMGTIMLGHSTDKAVVEGTHKQKGAEE